MKHMLPQSLPWTDVDVLMPPDGEEAIVWFETEVVRASSFGWDGPPDFHRETIGFIDTAFFDSSEQAYGWWAKDGAGGIRSIGSHSKATHWMPLLTPPPARLPLHGDIIFRLKVRQAHEWIDRGVALTIPGYLEPLLDRALVAGNTIFGIESINGHLCNSVREIIRQAIARLQDPDLKEEWEAVVPPKYIGAHYKTRPHDEIIKLLRSMHDICIKHYSCHLDFVRET